MGGCCLAATLCICVCILSGLVARSSVLNHWCDRSSRLSLFATRPPVAMRETRARKQSGVKWYEAKPAMDVDDFRRLLARKGQAEAENEAAQRAEEAEAAAQQAAEPDVAMHPAEAPHANGAVAMETGNEGERDEEAAGAAAGRDVAASLAASAALKQQEAAALASAQKALQVGTQALVVQRFSTAIAY